MRALVWLFCFALAIGAVLAGNTKLDNLAEAMRAIKASANEELVQLEGQQRADILKASNLLADLTSQVTEVSSARDKLLLEIDDLTHEIVPELVLKQNVTINQLSSLQHQSTVAKSELLTISRDSARNIDALSADLDSIGLLAQKIAEVLQNADVLAAATRQFIEVAARQKYTGPALNETCNTRDVISTVLNGLLQHLQESRDNEISHASQVKASYDKYIRSLDDQIASVRNASSLYRMRQLDAITRKGVLEGQVAQLNMKLTTLASRVSRLETFKQATLNAFSMRADMLSKTIEKCSKIIQLIVLLQAKMAVRTITTD